MMINYLGSPGRLTLHDDLNYGRKTKLPDARRARRNERRIRINLSKRRAETHNHVRSHSCGSHDFSTSFYTATITDRNYKKR